MTHICVSKLTTIGLDNGLSPGRRQVIIWTNAGILLIGTLGTNFSVILGEIHSFLFLKIHLKISSAKWRLFRLGLNELRVAYVSVVVSSTCLQNKIHRRKHQGLYSLSGKTSYRQISRSLEVARLDVTIIESLWNQTGISAALLQRGLSNFRTIGKV